MKNSIIKNFGGWLVESASTNEEQATATPGTGDPAKQGTALNTQVNFDFNFDSGKYKREEIAPESLTKLTAEIATKIVPEIRVPKTLDGKTTIELEASTSTLGLKPELATQLKNEGYAGTGNVALCNARMKTLETIIMETLVKYLKTDEASIRQKIAFKQVNKANQGGGATDEERKKWQYIKAKIVQTGTLIPEIQRLTCGKLPAPFAGVQGQASNNYVGYGDGANQELYIIAGPGMKMTLSLDPMSIPDCFYIKYGDDEFLSPFIGSAVWTPQNGQPIDYKKKLNEMPDLVEKINAELKAVGSQKDVKTLQPNFFGKDGKIAVLPGPDQGTAQNGIHSFTVTKEYVLDKLIFRVFSPLSGTRFNIKPSCQNPALTQQTAQAKTNKP